jgi:hypothetical protein
VKTNDTPKTEAAVNLLLAAVECYFLMNGGYVRLSDDPIVQNAWKQGVGGLHKAVTRFSKEFFNL